MKLTRSLVFILSGLFFAACLPAQELDPSQLMKPLSTDWPTYNGDYSGRRFSPLKQINRENVGTITLAWAFQTHGRSLESMPIEVGGIIYIAAGNEIWAIDARDGRQVWHFARPGVPAGGSNKGVAIWKDRLYMTTPDAQLLCIDAHNGKMLWQVRVDDPALKAFGGVTPLVIRDHIIIGTSGDTADLPGFLESVDPTDGKIQWRWDAMPKKEDTVAWNSWPHDTDVAQRGGGMTWITGTYDPELNLVYWGTGNPHPVENSEARVGANLYTCSIVALNPDTGKLAWYFQSSPHDTHDWDTVMTPVLFDGTFKGKPRKMLAQANKNGLFFVLDRTDGKALISEAFVPANWVKGYDQRGQPIPDPDREPKPDGVLVTGGVGTNWQAPSYDPETGLFYVNSRETLGVFYLTMPGKSAEGWAGRDFFLGQSKSMLKAIDVQSGKVRWTADTEGRGGQSGILTTAGHLVFTADMSQNLVALDASTGKVLWHMYPGGSFGTGPMTYQLDGRQYVVFLDDSVAYAFALPNRSTAVESARRASPRGALHANSNP